MNRLGAPASLRAIKRSRAAFRCFDLAQEAIRKRKASPLFFQPAGMRALPGLARFLIFAFCLLPFAFCLHQTSAQNRSALLTLFWPNGLETAPALRQAGIERLAVPSSSVAAWRAAGFDATPLDEAQREKLLVPRLAGRGSNVASATRRPWIDANGWRLLRNPKSKFFYDLTGAVPGKAALAAAEAFAYQADAIIKLDASELPAYGEMLKFLRTLPNEPQATVADIAVIDDGSPLVGEVMNLLARRNLLFQPVKAPLKTARLNLQLGTKAYPESAASDPSEFALRIRRELGDDHRSLRVYGAEVVICRLTSDGKTTRLHLLNYSGREVDSLRLKVKGRFEVTAVITFPDGKQTAAEVAVTDGATEFSLPRLGVYSWVELTTRR